MKKTVVKFIILYILIALLFSWVFITESLLFIIYTIIALIYFVFYYYWKRSHTYYVKENSILITRSWVFGTYQRELTFDKIQDVHVQQGFLAKRFKCGSVVFVTTTGLEVGYVGAGGGKNVYGGAMRPYLMRTSANAFLDIREPWKVRELIMKRIVAWREAFQQQRIATAVERIAEKTQEQSAVRRNIVEELVKLKELLDKGVITQEEYEKLKKKLLESA